MSRQSGVSLWPLRGPHQVGAPCKTSPGGENVECTVPLTAVALRKDQKSGSYKHGRYTEEMAATRRWLREATHMLRELNKLP